MTEQAQFCYRHPDVETGLRCNRCGKPICPKCARRTATGYRCPDCIKEQQKVFVTAQWYDYLTGFGTATFLSWVASLLFGLVSGFGGFYLLFFIVAIGAGAGSLIAEAVRFVIRKRRGRSLVHHSGSRCGAWRCAGKYRQPDLYAPDRRYLLLALITLAGSIYLPGSHHHLCAALRNSN